MIESGDIPHYRIGRLIRFMREDVDYGLKQKKLPVVIHLVSLKEHVDPASEINIDKVVRKTIDGLMG